MKNSVKKLAVKSSPTNFKGKTGSQNLLHPTIRKYVQRKKPMKMDCKSANGNPKNNQIKIFMI